MKQNKNNQVKLIPEWVCAGHDINNTKGKDKKMQKLLQIFLMLVVGVSLSACSSTQSRKECAISKKSCGAGYKKACSLAKKKSCGKDCKKSRCLAKKKSCPKGCKKTCCNTDR
ncbi:MAG: hypothetical protein GKR87_15780 [Kiritimatiellae bacterium]|nr:hypothetical protein [Kiritimatiellia bacterium]NKB25796.1 hypothetical protein [Kiritimatiellia bacterium]NKB25797.1 hypothetical protein [Kiritimatiellia bacterium]